MCPMIDIVIDISRDSFDLYILSWQARDLLPDLSDNGFWDRFQFDHTISQKGSLLCSLTQTPKPFMTMH
jgi:hypothetical protein